MTVDDNESTRQRLLRAAAEVFAEQGYQGARVADIARRAGLTTGAIYGRFTGKADLLLDAVDAASRDEMRRVLGGEGAAGDPERVLTVLGSHLVDPEVTDDQALLLEAIVAARREPELAEMLRRRFAQQDVELGRLVEGAKDDGAIDAAVDTEALVTFCHAVALGLQLYRAIGRTLPEPGEWSEVIDRLAHGVAPPAGSTRS